MIHTKKEDKKNKIVVSEKARAFYQNNIQYVYEFEKEREKSVVEQASRLLVVESIITAAFCQIISTCISPNSEMSFHEGVSVKTCFILGFLLVLSIIMTLLSQHRFYRKGTPNLYEIKEHISNNDENLTSEQLEYDYIEAYVEDMYWSLKRINSLRSLLLSASMITIVVILIVTIVISKKWMFGA